MIKNGWSYSNASKKLFEFEEKCYEALSEVDITGWNAWSILKTHIYFKIINNTLPNKFKYTNYHQKKYLIIIKSVTLFVRFFIKTYFLYLKNILCKKEVFIITSSSNKQKISNSEYFSDFIIDNFILNKSIESYIYTEFLDRKEENKLNTIIKSDLFLTDLKLVSLILFKILYKKKQFYNHAFRLHKIWYEFFKTSCPLDINEMQSLFITFKVEEFIFEKLFRVFKPKLILFTDLSPSGKAAAAKKLNITSIELQHGLMDEFYPQYQFYHEFKQIRKKIPIADKIGVFGEYHKRQLLSKGFYSDHEIFLSPKKIDKSKSTRISFEMGKKIILFATQGILIFDQTKKDLLDLIHGLDFNKFILIVKLHPLERDFCTIWYDSLSNLNSNILIIKNDYNIHEILPSVDIVISYFSTILLEALYFGKLVYSIVDDASPDGIFSTIGKDSILRKYIIVSSINEFLISISKNQYEYEHDLLVSEYLFHQDLRIDFSEYYISN